MDPSSKQVLDELVGALGITGWRQREFVLLCLRDHGPKLMEAAGLVVRVTKECYGGDTMWRTRGRSALDGKSISEMLLSRHPEDYELVIRDLNAWELKQLKPAS